MQAQDDKRAWLRFKAIDRIKRSFTDPTNASVILSPVGGRRTSAFRSTPWFAPLTNRWIIPGSFALKCGAQDDKFNWLRFKTIDRIERSLNPQTPLSFTTSLTVAVGCDSTPA